MSTTEPVLGIDLGTTNSLVAICDAAGPRILEGPDGERSLPSVVRYDERGAPVAIGRVARDEAELHPLHTVSSAKRLMGRSVADVEADRASLGYEIVAGEQDTARIALPGPGGAERIVRTPQEVSATILRTLRERAAAQLGADVRRAVVTVPAYFDDAQRQATRDAGRLAGLDVERVVNEPTAAALAYGIGLDERSVETIAVFDLGGGTFDVSLLRVVPGGDDLGSDVFRVLSTAGDTRLGGDDVDRAIMAMVLEAARERLGHDVALDPSSVQALRRRAVQAKHELSTRRAAGIELVLRPRDGGDAVEIAKEITREELDARIAPLVERTIAACRRALRDARLEVGDVERVILVGGATRMPIVHDRVASFFGVEPYTAIDPDEVVALGAAVQGAVLGGAAKDLLLMDVVPLSLGIETVGGAVAKLVMRNQSTPAQATEMFSTSIDGQTSIKLHVVQGEREMVADCRSLGTFHLTGIPPMPAGIPQLEVEFLVDASGVLNVAAVERRSGARATLQVVPSHGLTRDEVARIEAESIEHAREDMVRHRVVDLVANGRLDLKWIGDRLAAIGGELDPAYRAAIEARADELRALVDRADADWRSVDANELHAAKETLARTSVRMHEISIAASLRGDDGHEGHDDEKRGGVSSS